MEPVSRDNEAAYVSDSFHTVFYRPLLDPSAAFATPGTWQNRLFARCLFQTSCLFTVVNGLKPRRKPYQTSYLRGRRVRDPGPVPPSTGISYSDREAIPSKRDA